MSALFADDSAPVRTRANKALFDEWNLLGEMIKKQSAIVQNDLELSHEDWLNWENQNDNLVSEFGYLRRITNFWLEDNVK